MTKPVVVLFNGPPGSGKDFIAKAMERKFFLRGKAMKFAAPLKRGVPAFYGLTKREFAALDTYEAKKKPADAFLGLTPRDPQIGMSERFAKELHGKNVFGMLAVREMVKHRFKNKFFFSDCGFPDEVSFMVQSCQKMGYKVILIRIHRGGHTYEGDSRNYVYTKDLNAWCPNFDVTNDGTEAFVRNVKALLSEQM